MYYYYINVNTLEELIELALSSNKSEFIIDDKKNSVVYLNGKCVCSTQIFDKYNTIKNFDDKLLMNNKKVKLIAHDINSTLFKKAYMGNVINWPKICIYIKNTHGKLIEKNKYCEKYQIFNDIIFEFTHNYYNQNINNECVTIYHGDKERIITVYSNSNSIGEELATLLPALL